MVFDTADRGVDGDEWGPDPLVPVLWQELSAAAALPLLTYRRLVSQRRF
jgi:hypothetical protein